MTESVLDKKLRILGPAQDGDPAVLRAVSSKQWTARDAREYRKHVSGQAGIAEGELTHAERIAMTMRSAPRTTHF